ncbi:MAG: hypothetical protein AB8B74_02785 [Crocinitomicaceae bacterium]
MYNISDQQVDFILNDIERKGVVTEDVRYNILDHVCCIIENKMMEEMDFEEVYENTIAEFYLKELSEIEVETQKLLTFKHYYAMKRTLKITGIASIILIILGVLFKTMHWPGAGVIAVLGLAFFSLVFIPLNIVLKFQDDKESSNRIIMTVGMLSASVATMGVLFKIQHWPYANTLMFSSLLVFMLVFIPVYFIIKYRDPDTRFNAIINTTFMIGAAGMLFALINLGPSKKMQEMNEEIEMHEPVSELNGKGGIIILKTDKRLS